VLDGHDSPHSPQLRIAQIEPASERFSGIRNTGQRRYGENATPAREITLAYEVGLSRQAVCQLSGQCLPRLTLPAPALLGHRGSHGGVPAAFDDDRVRYRSHLLGRGCSIPAGEPRQTPTQPEYAAASLA